MTKKSPASETFKHPKTGHVAATSLPVEQNRLRAQGYVQSRTKSAQAPAPAGSASEPKK